MCAARYILAPPFSDIGDRSVYSEAVLDITLDIFDERFYNIAVRTPGVAKLGIALGSGPRDRGFKSRHSDHVGAKSTLLRHLFMLGKKASSARSLAPPFQLRPAPLGSQLVAALRAVFFTVGKYRY